MAQGFIEASETIQVGDDEIMLRLALEPLLGFLEEPHPVQQSGQTIDAPRTRHRLGHR